MVNPFSVTWSESKIPDEQVESLNRENESTERFSKGVWSQFAVEFSMTTTKTSSTLDDSSTLME